MKKKNIIGNKNLIKISLILILFILNLFGCKKNVDSKDLEEKNNLTYFKDSKKLFSGVASKMFINGSKEIKTTFQKGKKHGSFIIWFKNGQKKETGFFKNGKKDGKWVIYSENGKNIAEKIYHNGKVEKTKNLLGMSWNCDKNDVLEILDEYSFDILDTILSKNKIKTIIRFKGTYDNFDNVRGSIILSKNLLEKIELVIIVPKIILDRKYEDYILKTISILGKPAKSGDPYNSGNYTTQWSQYNNNFEENYSIIKNKTFIGMTYSGVYSDSATRKYICSIKLLSEINRKVK